MGVGEGGDGGLVGAEGAGDGGDAGDGRCRVPRQHAGQRAGPGGASGQHEPIAKLINIIAMMNGSIMITESI